MSLSNGAEAVFTPFFIIKIKDDAKVTPISPDNTKNTQVLATGFLFYISSIVNFHRVASERELQIGLEFSFPISEPEFFK